MRILIATTEYGFGTGIANGVENLRKQFIAKGHEVWIMSPIGPDVVMGNPKLWNRFGGLANIHFWKQVRKHIKDYEYEFDVALCRNPLFMKPVYFDKLVCSAHTTYLGRNPHQHETGMWRNAYYKYMIRQEKKAYKAMKDMNWIALTEEIGTEILALGIKKYKVIPNGVDTELYCLEGNKIDNTYLAATRLVSWKNVDRLIHKFNIKEGTWVLDIAGDGPEYDKLDKMACTNQIQFHGSIKREDLIKLYQTSKYYVSESAYEGMPNSLLEALSCGCIPMVSDISGHKEIVDALGVETDPIKIHAFMKQHYDWSIIADKYLEVFNGQK